MEICVWVTGSPGYLMLLVMHGVVVYRAHDSG